MIQLIYSRNGLVYDHLRFRSVRFMNLIVSGLGEIKIISIREI